MDRGDDTRWTDLEVRLAYQDRTIEQQAEALVACEQRIDELEKQLARLAARLSSDEEDEGM